MKFPKQFMTITELEKLGLSRETLNHLYHDVGFPLAFKETSFERCPIKFNTELLAKYLQKLNSKRS